MKGNWEFLVLLLKLFFKLNFFKIECFKKQSWDVFPKKLNEYLRKYKLLQGPQ